MCMPHHIQTLARTCTLALVCVCAWICLCAGMSTSASATTLASTRDIQSLTGIQNARSTTRANILLDAAATPAADTTISRIEVHSGTAVVSLTPPTSSGSSGLAYYQSTCSATGQPSVTSRSSAASNSVLIENLTPGISYDCTFSAYNLDGLGSPESAYITVLVSAGNTTVSIASPADGAVFSVPAPNNGVVGTAVPITATVTTASGAVLSKIEYFESTHSIGISSITSYAWTPLVPGVYTVTAKVTDSTGATGVSAPVIITVADASGETITFLHNDFAGSAIAATDAAGALLWKENYTPFGDRAVKAVNATGNRQWYTGKPVDSETGLSNFGARMYDPVVGRFMGVDAVGFSEGNLHSFNRYAYANNNPYRFVDPDGNEPEATIGLAPPNFFRDTFVGGLIAKTVAPVALFTSNNVNPLTGYIENFSGDKKAEAAISILTAPVMGTIRTESQIAKGLLAEARYARDALAESLFTELGKRAPATVTGGYNSATREVAAAACGGGKCAENLVSEAFGGGSNVKFTEAVRPRNSKEVKICERCESTFGRDAFSSSGAKFHSDGGN